MIYKNYIFENKTDNNQTYTPKIGCICLTQSDIYTSYHQYRKIQRG